MYVHASKLVSINHVGSNASYLFPYLITQNTCSVFSNNSDYNDIMFRLNLMAEFKEQTITEVTLHAYSLVRLL